MPKADDYEHLPIEIVRLEWIATANERRVQDSRVYGHEFFLNLDVALHPNSSGRIIINYPGYEGNREGYMDKHKKLASFMQGENLGAVIRTKGPGHRDFYGFTDDVLLRKVMTYSLENAEKICGKKNPEVFLIGTSAGGGAVAATAAEFSEVKRILLMAPAANIGARAINEGLGKFTGEVHIVIGQDDRNVGTEAGTFFYGHAKAASRRELFTIPNCDHHFTGELNGRIMSQAPFYAFAQGERPKFPDPEGGMALY